MADLYFEIMFRSSSSSSSSTSYFSSSSSLSSSSSSSSSSSLSSSSISSSSSSLSSSSSTSSSSSQSFVIEKSTIHANAKQYLTGIEFVPDGSRFYISGVYADRIYYWDTNSNWSIDNGGIIFYQDGYIEEDYQNNIHTARFADDGNLLFVNGIESIDIRKYSLSTPYDMTTKNSIQVNDTVWSGGGLITISPDGRYINRGDFIYEMTTPYDLSTLQSPISYSIVGVQCSFMVPNGLRSYGILVSDRQTIIRHNFSAAWDANSVTGYDVLFTLNTSFATSLWGIYVKEYSGYVDIYLCEGIYQYTHDMVRCRYYTEI